MELEMIDVSRDGRKRRSGISNVSDERTGAKARGQVRRYQSGGQRDRNDAVRYAKGQGSRGRERASGQISGNRNVRPIDISRPPRPPRQDDQGQYRRRTERNQPERFSGGERDRRRIEREQVQRGTHRSRSLERIEIERNTNQRPRRPENARAQQERMRRPENSRSQRERMERLENSRAQQERMRRRRTRRRKQLAARMAAPLLLVVLAGSLIFALFRLFIGEPKVEDTIARVDPGAKREEPARRNGVLKPDIEEDFLPLNEYSRPGEELSTVNNIFVHYTANKNTSAAQNRSYFENLATTGETSASAHFIIGYEGEIIQCVPLDEIAYAVQKRNYDSISIECCYLSDDGKFTDATYQSLIRLSAWLLEEYDLTPADMRRHYDEGGKKCPLYFVEHADAWEQFKKDLEDCMASQGGENA